MNENILGKVADEILRTEEFVKANYYVLSMKKPAWRIFQREKNKVPYFLLNLFNLGKEIITRSGVNTSSIVNTLSDDQCYWYVLLTLIKLKDSIEGSKEIIFFSVVDGNKSISDYFEYNDDMIIAAYLYYLVDRNLKGIVDLRNVICTENFQYEVNKYKLTKVKGFESSLQGFIFDKKYYLYNWFILSDRQQFSDKCPATFKLFEDEFKDYDIYLRLDENLAVPEEEAISTATYDFEKYRGISFTFNSINSIFEKQIIVHYNPKTMDKLLMVLKPDIDNEINKKFYHRNRSKIKVEQWYKLVNVTLEEDFRLLFDEMLENSK